ncbi:alphaTry.2 family protein [Megaselia abdita]
MCRAMNAKYLFAVWIVNILKVQAIIPGIPSAINNHPFQVALLSNDKFIGGGVIIERNIVLSDINAYNQLLLQYLWPSTPVKLTIRAGSSNNNEGGQVVNVARTVLVKIPENEWNDLSVSILLLENNLTFSDTIKKIGLAKELPSSLPLNCSISGWGYTRNDYVNLPIQLQVGRAMLVEDRNCNVTEPNNYLCLTGADACIGDSGGPLVCGGELVGLASDLQHCGTTTFTGSYNKIPLLYDRIMDVVKGIKG